MIGVGMNRHYGLSIGDRGTHFISRDAEIEVVGLHPMDNNRATYCFYGGDRSGETFSATAEHFEPKAKEANCPTCGARVYSIFDHLGDDCPAETDRRL